MTTKAADERVSTPDTAPRRWGWAILLLTSGISLAFNIGHAINGNPKAPAEHPAGQSASSHPFTHVPMPLAVLYGVAPVLVAMMLSHLIAIQNGGKLKRFATGAVFVAAMSLSVRSIYEVLQPLAGSWGLLFAAMLDISALLALNEVLAASHRDTTTDRDIDADHGADVARHTTTHHRDASRDMGRDMGVSRQRDMAPGSVAEGTRVVRGDVAPTQRDIPAARRPALPAPTQGTASGTGTTARKRLEETNEQVVDIAARRHTESARKPAGERPAIRSAAAQQQADSLAKAQAILATEPNISGAELGRRLGLTPRQGQRLIKEITEQPTQQPTAATEGHGTGRSTGGDTGRDTGRDTKGDTGRDITSARKSDIGPGAASDVARPPAVSRRDITTPPRTDVAPDTSADVIEATPVSEAVR